jgi:hypothetical protein
MFPEYYIVAERLGVDPGTIAWQVETRAGFEAAYEIVMRERSTFGGAYLSTDGGWHLELLVTGRDRAAEEYVRSQLPGGAPVRWTSVLHSLKDLDRVLDDLRVTEAGKFARLGIDVIRNKVEIWLKPAAYGREAEIHERWGAQVVVKQESVAQGQACTSRLSCTPWRGGIRIGLAGQWKCTYGFNARRNLNDDIVALTAGHCKSGTWQHPLGATIGATQLNNWPKANGLGDAQRIAAADFDGLRNLVYYSDAYKGRAITSRYYLGGMVNDWVCVSGGWSFTACGQITATGVLVEIQDPDNPDVGYVHNQNIANYFAGPGDSGGPVFFGNTAYGIHSTGLASFSAIGLVEDALDVKVCSNGSCTSP